MATLFSVSMPTIGNEVQAMSDATARIASNLENLDGGIQQNYQYWTGAAASQYVIAHQKWMDAIGQMHQLLSELSSTLDSIGLNYDQQEKIGRDMWGSVAAMTMR